MMRSINGKLNKLKCGGRKAGLKMDDGLLYS